MSELFPVLAGVLAGAGLSGLAPRMRVRLGVALAVTLGISATVLSGEFRIGWEYLLIDIPLVAVSALVGYAVPRRWRGGSLSTGDVWPGGSTGPKDDPSR